MNKNIHITNIAFRCKTILFSLLTLFAFTFVNAQTPEYATFSGGNSGTGQFTCSEMPNFTYSVTGDFATGDTNIPGAGQQAIGNGAAGFEAIFGDADTPGTENIEVEVAGFTGGVGQPISNTVTTTITFDSPTPPGSFGFIIADVEQDQVIVSALDAAGNAVPDAVINNWLLGVFDADPASTSGTGVSNPPTWDANNTTLVGEFAPTPMLQTIYIDQLPDNEAGAASFLVDISISQLTFESQAIGVAPDDPSQHFLFATTCEPPTCEELAAEPALCTYIFDNPTSDIALADCDLGGVNNITECQTGENPTDPTDDCTAIVDANLDICTIINGPTCSNLGAADCDGGGLSNAEECAQGLNPSDPADDVMTPCEAPGCNPVPNLMVCSDGTTRTIGCEAGLENNNVIWFNGMGQQVATGCEFVIDASLIQNGNVGDMMCFYYEAVDAEGCMIQSCCPIIAEVVDCGFYDLALIKEQTATGPYSPGEDVNFSITVCNQGTLDASNVEITDLIPSDMTLSTADANGWVGPLVGPVTNTIPSIPIGQCQSVDILLTINPDFMGNSIINNAVISSDDGDDIDSDPDVLAMLDDLADNDDLLEVDGGDDEDPEQIFLAQVYDLALIKEEASVGPYNAGDVVTYTITVCNQGTLDASNVGVTDYIPVGMTLSAGDANGWAGPLTGPVTNSIPSLTAGSCSSLDIDLAIDANFMGTSIVNFAEISTDDGDDIDSTPDSVNGNDAGGAEGTASDDVLIGDGTGTPGSPVAATDEDDHDPEQIMIAQVYDLALIKEEASSGPYLPGDDVMYSITVCNQGTLDASNVTVTDYIPTGMTLSAADANGWAGPLAGPVNMTIPAIAVANCEVVNIVLTIDEDFMGTSIVNFAEISADDGDDIDSTPDTTNGNDAGGAEGTASDDVLIGDGTGTPGSPVAATDEDDHDPEQIEVGQIFDLALIKEESSTGPYAPGDDVTYTITVTNQGTIDATSFEVTDYIPSGMTLSGTNMNPWAGPLAGPVRFTGGALAVGATTSIDIILTIDDDFMGTTIVNFAEISDDANALGQPDVDSTPDANDANDAGGMVNSPADDFLDGDGSGAPGNGVAATDEDDHDPEDIVVGQIFDLALIKEESSAGPYAPGDDVTYTITVTNQGTIDATSFELTDYIPAGMTLSAADANGWTGPDAGPVTVAGGALAAGASTAVDIVLTIDDDFMGTSLVNFAEISDDANALGQPDVDSTPDANDANDAGGMVNSPADDFPNGDGSGAPGNGVAATDEDDHDPEDIVVGQIFDLALIKEESSAGPYAPGDDVTYTITVTNQGTIDATSFELTDYIPAGMTLSAADANGWAGPAAGPVTVAGGALAAGASTAVDIVLTIDDDFMGTSLVNFAEISDDANALGQPDVDSTPDVNDANDAGGMVNSPADDFLDGDGSGAPGNGVAATDEDDHDPEDIVVGQIFDLALVKEESSAGPYAPGDDVTYTITVTNQGTIDATSFELTDYIPAGMTLSAADANGWTGPAAGPVTVTGGALAAGASTAVDIVLTIDDDFMGTSLVNFAEISDDANALGQPDVDSTPDANDANDAGGMVNSPADDFLDGDGSGAPGNGVAATDEDDHDPEDILVGQIFDLALVKEESSAGPYAPGDDVTYTITVTNQGTIDATSFELTDYIPAGMTLSAADANGWTGPDAGPVTVAGGALAAGASTAVDIVLTIDDDFMGTSLVNFAEISDDANALGQPDVDSTPDANDANDAGGMVNSPADDFLDGDGSGAPGNGVAATDEDDHDPEDIVVGQIFDLALVKEESSAGPYAAGDDVTYTITVTNQGTIDATSFELTDYIPTGMTLSAADANGWAGPAAGPVTVAGGPLAAGASTAVDIVLTIDDDFMGTSLVNFAEISDDTNALGQPDVDSTPDTNDANDAGGAPDTASDDVVGGDGSGAPGDTNPATDEDDHDPEQIEIGQIFDLALIKEESSAGPYAPGDDVTYTITVTNQGTIDATSFELTDYIPAGMTLSAADANGWTGPAAGPVTVAGGALAVGASTAVDIVLTIDDDFMGTSLVNFAEISDDANALGQPDVDSTPDANDANDAGGAPDTPSDDVVGGDGSGAPGDTDPATDEDDHDPEQIEVNQIYDLALIKTETSTGPYLPGEDVTYTITVCNQGTLDANNVIVTDYVPADMTLSTSDNNGWAGAGPVNAVIPSIAAGLCETIDIVLTIDPAFAGGVIVNFAEISADDGDDVDSTPDTDDGNDPGGIVNSPTDDIFNGDGIFDEDDHDPEDILVEIFDLALVKTVSPNTPSPFDAGDVVTFDIEVTNQGSTNAFAIGIVDYIPAGLILIDNNWSMSNGNAVLNNPITFLAPGSSTTRSITFLIDPAFMGTSIINNAEISSADNNTNPFDTPPTDVDSTPGDNATPDDLANNDDTMDTMGGDDQDPEMIAIGQVYDLALIKQETSSGPYMPGDDVEFTITVCNQGTLDAANIEVTDYIPVGMTFASSPDFAAAGANAVATIASLPVSACEDLVIVLTIDPDFQGTSISNNAEITADDGDDVDSTPGDNSQPNDFMDDDDMTETDGGDDEDPELIMVEQMYDLALIKEELSAGPYIPGDDVTYTITVCNQGSLDAMGVEVTDYIPAEMTLSSSDNNGWTSAGAVATNVIPSVAVGACEMINIVLTIDPAFAGGDIINFAEISADDGDDLDSTPDSTNGNDAGGNPESPSDDELDGDGTGAPGDSVAGTDEDDHDPELITVEIFDLALTKTLSPNTPGPSFDPGDVVTFDLTVENQGTINAFNIDLVDYVPQGLILVDNAWTLVGGNADLNSPISFLQAGASTTVQITFLVDPGFTGASIVNDSEISAADNNTNPFDTPPTDVDSTPGDDATPIDLAGNDDTMDMMGGDDQDPELIMINQIQEMFDLALIKTINAATPGPYFSGDVVTFDIMVVNQGNVDAFNIQVTDYIPAGLTLADANWTNVGTDAVLLNPISFLAAGDNTVVTISFLIDASAGGEFILNDSEISDADDDTNPFNTPPTDIDSTPDSTNGNDAGGAEGTPSDDVLTGDGTGVPGDMNPITDEDDHDPEGLQVCKPSNVGLIFEGSANNCLVPGETTVRNAISGGFTVSPGDELVYILVENGDIVDVAIVAEFTISAPGDYSIHPVIFDPAECDVPTLGTVADILDSCTCFDIDLVGVPAPVETCCPANAGGLADIMVDGCADTADGSMASVSAVSVGANIPAGSTILYILTSNGVIEATSTTPSFMVDMSGAFSLHTLVYNPAEFDLSFITEGTTVINQVNQQLLNQDTCGDIDLNGSPIQVNDCNMDCPFDLILPVTMPILFEAENTITSDAIITSGPVEFSAGFEITLEAGFEVTLGTEFEAFIEGCMN